MFSSTIISATATVYSTGPTEMRSSFSESTSSIATLPIIITDLSTIQPSALSSFAGTTETPNPNMIALPIVAVIVAVLICVAVVAIGVFLYRRREAKKAKKDPTPTLHNIEAAKDRQGQLETAVRAGMNEVNIPSDEVKEWKGRRDTTSSGKKASSNSKSDKPDHHGSASSRNKPSSISHDPSTSDDPKVQNERKQTSSSGNKASSTSKDASHDPSVSAS